MKLQLTDIYRILSDIAKNTNGIKTFAALKFREEFNDVALNKSALYLENPNTDLFYSESWENDNYNVNKVSISYPALLGFSNSARVGHGFNPIFRVEIYLAVIETKGAKVWEVTMTELDALLISVIRNLQNYVYVESNEFTGWASESTFKSNVENNIWSNATIVTYLKERLKTRQLTLDRGYADTPKNLVTVGTSVEIQGCV